MTPPQRPIEIAVILERDDVHRAVTLPAIPRLRPGMAVTLDGENVLVTEARFFGEKMKVVYNFN